MAEHLTRRTCPPPHDSVTCHCTTNVETFNIGNAKSDDDLLADWERELLEISATPPTEVTPENDTVPTAVFTITVRLTDAVTKDRAVGAVARALSHLPIPFDYQYRLAEWCRACREEHTESWCDECYSDHLCTEPCKE